MLKIKSIVVMLALVSFSTAFAVQPEKSLKVVGEVPQGVTVMKNKVMVKSGFTVTKVSDNKVSIMSRKNNNTTGSFECGCSAGGGGCKVVIQGSSITCVETGACTKGVCEMTTSIPAIKVMQ